MLHDLVAFLVAFVGSLILVPPIRRLAIRIGMVDEPGPRKVHLEPIPLLGGLAIYAGFVLALLVTLHGAVETQTVSILGGATLVAAVGIFDDRGLLHHQIKLFVAMPAAACFLLASGIRAQVFSRWLGGSAGFALDVLLTLLWTVGVTAAFSILDHMDGLCVGVVAIAALFFFLAATLSAQVLVRVLAATTFGAALGFLRWNFSPAKIFMGDGGAMFLGFLMASLGLKIRLGLQTTTMSWMVPVLILGVPIFDTTLVFISRARRGLVPFMSPGKDHTAHRLSNLGLGYRGTVVSLYGLGLIFGALALIVPKLSPVGSWTLLGFLVLGSLLAIFFLEGVPYERQSKLERTSLLS